LVLDYSLLVRDVDGVTVHRLVEALSAGEKLPPVEIDEHSRRVVDGFHRVTAWRRLYQPTEPVPCIPRSFASDSEMFLAAAAANARHGRPLSSWDCANILRRADELGISRERIAEALAVRAVTLDKIAERRFAYGESGETIVLKNTIRHMAGGHVTCRQVAANERLSGLRQTYFVNQVIWLLENDLIDPADRSLAEKLDILADLLAKRTMAIA
jgi:hypothetical protein